MAHTKALGSSKWGRDSASQRLGIKVNHGEGVKVGEIIIRQRGTHYIPGRNVRRGGDDTLYAGVSGTVRFSDRMKTRFDGTRRRAKLVSITKATTAAAR
jgi:large subunit ribosomal protein L27